MGEKNMQSIWVKGKWARGIVGETVLGYSALHSACKIGQFEECYEPRDSTRHMLSIGMLLHVQSQCRSWGNIPDRDSQEDCEKAQQTQEALFQNQ